jgi:type IV secretion system protein VirB5
MKKIIYVSLLSICLHLNVHAQGIPTIDVANLAQSINQVLAWKQQYEQMLQQIEQMRLANATALNAYNASTGNRGFGLINNSITKSVITPEFYSSLQATKTPQDANALVSAQLEQISASTNTRFTQIQQLMAAINATNDPKAISELNARIQSEQAMIQNEAKEVDVLRQHHALQLAAIQSEWLATSIRANSRAVKDGK